MRESTAPEPKHPIGSVDNALKLLLMFREQPLIRISEASEALGVGRSTGHRLMAMLAYHGFVEQDPLTKAYRSGPALAEIGLQVVRRMDIRGYLRPFIEELVRTVNETVHVVVLNGDRILFLDGVESTRSVRTGLRTGISRPAHCTAAGKVLLAELSPEELRALYPSPRLEPCTPRTVKTRAGLERQLAEIREKGYSVTVGESELDIAAVAMAIRDVHGRARVSLGVSVPLARLDADVHVLIEPLRQTVTAASVGLA